MVKGLKAECKDVGYWYGVICGFFCISCCLLIAGLVILSVAINDKNDAESKGLDCFIAEKVLIQQCSADRSVSTNIYHYKVGFIIDQVCSQQELNDTYFAEDLLLFNMTDSQCVETEYDEGWTKCYDVNKQCKDTTWNMQLPEIWIYGNEGLIMAGGAFVGVSCLMCCVLCAAKYNHNEWPFGPF